MAGLNKNYIFSPSIHTRICSRHFKVSDYVTNFGTKKLKSDAIPSIFYSPRILLNGKKLLWSRYTPGTYIFLILNLYASPILNRYIYCILVIIISI